MKYLHEDAVKRAVAELQHIHPFFGITLLACKRAELDIGTLEKFAIAREEEKFLLECYHPNQRSKFYFQPFRTSDSGDRWLSPKYPSAGSQSTRTRGLLASSFLHIRGTDQWAWDEKYVAVLREKLDQDGTSLVPAFWLAVWLFRNRKWADEATAESVVQLFISEFHITHQESILFGQDVPQNLPKTMFHSRPFSDARFLAGFEPAPDVEPDEGGTLHQLQLRGVGPAERLDFSPAERLSIITGDNGLGKTFLLECAWWSLTGHWAEGKPAFPSRTESRTVPSISFSILGSSDDAGPPKRTVVPYDWSAKSWAAPKKRPTIPGLIVYARVDGSFAVWDPAQHGTEVSTRKERLSFFRFTRDQVLEGLDGRIEGLIRDWVRWQNNPDQQTFEIFKSVLARLSPPDMAPLTPGQPMRLPDDPRDIPTLLHSYSQVPFTHESAGVKRIVALAYLLVWAWNEHKVYSGLAQKKPQGNMAIMVDEIEAHLHPRWQRSILPALLDVSRLLSKEIKPQLMVATHSPLILASIESDFSEDSDALFHLYLDTGRSVEFKEIPFLKHGTVDAWLTSEIFALKQARSREGESAMEQARSILASSSSDIDRIRPVHMELANALPAEDPFWPRWLHYLEMKGVSV
jgi:hypothetical protein